MLRKVSSLVVVAACLLVTTVAGDSPQWKSLLKTPGPPNENGDVSLYVGPVVFDHQLFGPYEGPYGARNSSDGAWAVSQWSNPSPITNESSLDSPVNPMCSVAGAYDASWSLSTASVRICGATASPTSSFFTPNASVVQLAQSGGSTLSCGVEYDLFLSPVDNNYPMFPQNVQPVALDDTIINIELSLKLQLEYLSISSRCSDVAHECTSSSPDYAYGTIGLPLSNPTTDETIFFQILLFDSRALLSSYNTCPMYDACNNGTDINNGWYFEKLPTLGVNFGSSYFPNQPCIAAVGDAAAFSFGVELLDALRGSIKYAAEHFSADGNRSHWYLGGLYVGTGMQGMATSTISVGEIQWRVLQSETK